MNSKRITLLSNIIDYNVDKHQFMISRYLNDPAFDIRSTNEYDNFNFGWTMPQDLDLKQPAAINVIKSAVDTLVSKISNQKCRPYFSSLNGTYRTRQIIKQVQSFFDVLFDFENVNEKISNAFRFACISGTGTLFLNPFTDRLMLLNPWTLGIQSTEKSYGENTDMLIKFNNYPTTLIEDYNESWDYVQYCIYINIKEHKAYEIINGKVTKEQDYKAEILPIVQLHYCNPVDGTKTTSITEELYGIQSQIDMINQKIAAAAQTTPANAIYLLDGSSLQREEVTAKTGHIYQVRLPPGRDTLPIHQVNPAPFDPVWQHLLDYYIRMAFETIGLSMLSATGKKPAGVDSGVAIATLEDVESDRFETQLNSFIRAYIKLAEVYIKCMPATANILPNKQSFKWKDVLKEQNNFKIKYSAATFLSKQPSEQIKQIQQLSQVGLIGVEKISQLLDNPDLEEAYAFSQAAHNAIDKVIEQTLEGVEIKIPKYVSYENLAKSITQTQNELYASLTGKDDDEINEQIKRLSNLEDRLYKIMEKDGFIESEKLEGPVGNEEGLQVNNQVGTAPNIADMISQMSGMNDVEPNENLANGPEIGEM